MMTITTITMTILIRTTTKTTTRTTTIPDNLIIIQASGRSAALQSADGSTDEASAQWLVAVPAATTTFPSRCVGDVVCRNLHMLRDTPLMHTRNVIQTAHKVNILHLQRTPVPEDRKCLSTMASSIKDVRLCAVTLLLDAMQHTAL